MWFLSAIGETGRGQQPDHQLRYTENDDGIHWEAPETFATAEEGFFDNAGGGAEDWQMVLARGTNLYGTRPFPGQGLWLAEPESSRPTLDTPPVGAEVSRVVIAEGAVRRYRRRLLLDGSVRVSRA
jgi:hypothetical protein